MELNKIYNDDCENALKYINKGSVDLIFSSPPYADIRDYGHPDSQCKPEEYIKWFIPKAKVFKEILKDSGSFILNIGDKVTDRCIDLYIYKLIIALEEQVGFRRFETIFWDKGCSPPGKRFRPTVEYIFWFVKEGCEKDFKFNLDNGRIPYDSKTIARYRGHNTNWHTRNTEKEECPECGNKMVYRKDKLICSSCLFKHDVNLKKIELNPKGALPSTLLKIGSEAKNTGFNNAVFPVRLPKYFIPIATDKKDVVYDPFMGAGTTAIACMELDRYYIGTELVEKNHKEGEERVLKHKEKLNSGINANERTGDLF